MHVLIYEPIFWGGHNLSYVRHLVRTLAEWPVRITVVTGKTAEDSEGFKSDLKPYLDGVGDLQATVPPATQGSDWGKHYYDELVNCIDDLEPDHVFIPTGDVVAAYAGSRRLRGSLRRARSRPEIDCNVLSAFYQSIGPWAHKRQRLRTSIYASYAPWTRSYTIDPFVSVGSRPWRWIHGSIPEVLPDPIDVPVVASRAEARRALGLPEGESIIGSVGHFASSERKNPLGLLQGFLESGLQKHAMVALIGSMSPSVLNFVATLGQDRKRVIIIDRYLTSEEVQLAVGALDLVCLPYQDFFQPSGIALYAAVLGRPVLASHTGWFQAMIPLFKLGWTADLSTPSHIARALREYRPKWEAFSPSDESQKLAVFSQWQNYTAIFCRQLRRRLGVRTATSEISWESLVQRA